MLVNILRVYKLRPHFNLCAFVFFQSLRSLCNIKLKRKKDSAFRHAEKKES